MVDCSTSRGSATGLSGRVSCVGSVLKDEYRAVSVSYILSNSCASISGCRFGHINSYPQDISERLRRCVHFFFVLYRRVTRMKTLAVF